LVLAVRADETFLRPARLAEASLFVARVNSLAPALDATATAASADACQFGGNELRGVVVEAQRLRALSESAVACVSPFLSNLAAGGLFMR